MDGFQIFWKMPYVINHLDTKDISMKIPINCFINSLSLPEENKLCSVKYPQTPLPWIIQLTEILNFAFNKNENVAIPKENLWLCFLYLRWRVFADSRGNILLIDYLSTLT